jgi:aspartyl-tRNA(Asn)/glutamyl-tRNA(Gln) amidotransferase subunit C
VSALTLAQVQHVAKLARLELTPEEQQRTLGQLQQVLDAIATLEELDTSNVVATYQVNLTAGFTRDDQIEPPLPIETALANAPQRVGNHFAVPKILD